MICLRREDMMGRITMEKYKQIHHLQLEKYLVTRVGNVRRKS